MRIKNTSNCYYFSISVCMGAFVLGYELTSFGNLGGLVKKTNFPDGQDSGNFILVLACLLPLSAILGVGIYRWMIRYFGYVQTFKVTDYLTIIASFVGMLSLSTGVQVCSRILFGLVAGINTIIVPTYLTSLLPGSMGGPCGTVNQLFITIGIFFGFQVGFLTIDGYQGMIAWRIIAGIPIIPALIRLHTSQNVFHYESIEKIIQCGDDQNLENYLNWMYEDFNIEQYKQVKSLKKIDIEEEQATFYDPLGESYYKRLFLSCGLIMFNQLSGGDALAFEEQVLYPPQIQGDDKYILTLNVYLSLVQVIITFLAGRLMGKYGFKNVMLEGIRIIVIALILVAFIGFFVPDLYAFIVISSFIQKVGFSLSYGPCCFVLATCILQDIWLPSTIFWIMIFMHEAADTVPIQTLGLGGLTFLFFIIQIFALIYVSGNLIEPSGKTRAEYYEQFRKRAFPRNRRSLNRKKENKKSRDVQIELLEPEK